MWTGTGTGTLHIPHLPNRAALLNATLGSEVTELRIRLFFQSQPISTCSPKLSYISTRSQLPTTRGNMQPECVFESLAPELVLAVVTRLPDLESLDKLLRASPVASRLFDNYGVEIMEALPSKNSHSLTHKFTRSLICIVALLRYGALPPQVHDMDSFQRLVRFETMNTRYRPWKSKFIPLPLPSDTPATHELLDRACL